MIENYNNEIEFQNILNYINEEETNINNKLKNISYIKKLLNEIKKQNQKIMN